MRGRRVGEWSEKARSLLVSGPLLVAEGLPYHWGFREDHFSGGTRDSSGVDKVICCESTV